MKPVKVGIVGAGGIGHVHARAWAEHAPRAKVVAIADVAPERAAHLAAEVGGDLPVFADLEAMLAGAEINVVDICLPHDLHAGAIIAAARAGTAILCEKPLCTNLDDATAIREALRESGVPFMAAHNQLFQPSLIEARRLLGSGGLGRPFVIRSIEAMQNRGFASHRHASPIGAGESPWAWRIDVARSGGGEVIDTGWHATYRLLALADERPVEVSAMMGQFAVTQLAAEDTGAILVRFTSGAIGEILTSWAFAPVGNWHFEVAAEYGSMAGSQSRLLHQLHGWPEPAVSGPYGHGSALTFAAEITHFLDVVQHGEPGLASFDHAARVLQVTLAAYAAAAGHCVVALPEDPVEAGVPVG